MNVKKVFSYIAAFFAGVFSVILTVLFNNRRRDTEFRKDTDNTTDAYRRAEDRNKQLDRRVEESKSEYEKAAEIFKKVRSRKHSTESSSANSSDSNSNNNL